MANDQIGPAAIRTPDQRLRIFVSSTLAELADERGAVARAISALRLIPVMFELGARPHPPRELYRAYLVQSDIFVGLYWQRYGWIGPGMDISGLEDEFRLSLGIPRLLYVKTPAPDREPALAAMLDQLKAEGSVSYRTFRSSRELSRLVRDDLAVLLSERFAATIEHLAGQAPMARDGERRERSLPVTSTSLIGRSHDIDKVAALLEASDVRLVTLTGPGGIGKTRLALAVAERLDDRYPQGVVYASLASVAEPELVLPRICAVLGATIDGARPLDVLVEHIADTPTLLVLDNLEQVIGVAPELDELLARCPAVRILATSRTVLRLRAEREYPVGALDVPTLAGPSPLEQVALSSAVTLFVDRARAVRYDFALTDENAPAVLGICRRLDGLPLAIELAAARIRLLDPAALLERLESGLDALGPGPIDLPERQRTLRATVEWSIGLLDPEELDMLVTMSVFVDGWSIEAAVAVAALSEDRTLDLLDALAGHSLVIVDASDHTPRFRMLASIRELVAERLAARPDASDVARRHAEHFGALVENADWPAERQAEWAARLLLNQADLAAAIRWFLAHDIAPLPRILRILWLLWQLGDRMPEGRAWIAELLLRADELDVQAQAESLVVSAFTASEVGDDESALAALDGIRRVEAQIADPYLQSAAQLAASWVLPLVDDIEGALRAAMQAREGFRRQNEPFLGWAVFTVGLLEMTLGRHDAALVSLSEAQELGARFGNHWLESASRSQLASLAVRTGHLEDARAYLSATVHPDGDIGLNMQIITFALVASARVALAEGDARRAAMELGAADGLRRRAGLRAWPSMRRDEAELLSRVTAEIDPAVFDAAFASGVTLDRRDALALMGTAERV